MAPEWTRLGVFLAFSVGLEPLEESLEEGCRRATSAPGWNFGLADAPWMVCGASVGRRVVTFVAWAILVAIWLKNWASAPLTGPVSDRPVRGQSVLTRKFFLSQIDP